MCYAGQATPCHAAPRHANAMPCSAVPCHAVPFHVHATKLSPGSLPLGVSLQIQANDGSVAAMVEATLRRIYSDDLSTVRGS